MAKVECYNCKQVTEVLAPKFRCGLCNYPLHKYIEQSEAQPEDKVIKDIDQQDQTPPIVINVTGTGKGDEVNINKGDKAPASPKAENHIEIPKTERTINIAPVDKFDSTRHNDLLKELRAHLSNVNTKNEARSATGLVAVKVENLNPEKKGKVTAGWLVVHTENKKPFTYELFEGENLIGRPDGPHHLDIKLADDPYISRVHCTFKVEKDLLHRFRYVLVDSEGSTNGTYVNGIENPLSKSDQVFLRDGDTVQVGETKLVFKNTNNAINFKDAASNVLENDYTKTVAIKL